ncbi:MAG: DUF1993 family protein, partial [Stenotrophobium sp.]
MIFVRIRMKPDLHPVQLNGEHPMKMSMYHASVPVLTRGLSNLAVILDKGAVHAEAKKIDPAVLVNSRL